MAHPPLQLPFQLKLDFLPVDKHHLKLIPSHVVLCVDGATRFSAPLRETLFKEAKESRQSPNEAFQLTCQIRYESSVAVYMHYKRKPTGEIMRTDDNSQKFWDKLGSNISGFLGSGVNFPVTIDGRPTLTALVAIEKVAEEAFVKVTNANMPTHQDTLPTIAILWRILRKVRAFRAYNQQAFTYAGLHLHALTSYLVRYPPDLHEWLRSRKLSDMEGQPLDVHNLRYNAEEDLLSHIDNVLEFASHCSASSIGIPSETFHDTFGGLVHYTALCLDTICYFVTIYFAATYKAICMFDPNALTLFSRCHDALLYSRMRLILTMKHRAAEIVNIPLPFGADVFAVLNHLYCFAKAELRIDPNWPTESFTAALIGVRGPVFNSLMSKIRTDIIGSWQDAHMRDMLRRLAAHILQRSNTLPAQLMLLSGKTLTLTRAADADKQKQPIPAGEGSYASVYQASYRPPAHKTAAKVAKVEYFALKCMRFLSGHNAEDLRNQRQRMILELVNTWMLAHRHVLSLKAVYFDAALSPLILVFPWMSNSNVRMRLRDYLEGRQLYNGKLHNLSNRWMGQISLGLEYVHKEGIIHGDLRGVNILVDVSEDIKIADFGLSLYAEGTSKNYASAREGNPVWTAPELFDRVTMERLRATRESDIYSFAMICIELWTLADPIVFPGDSRPRRPNSPDPQCDEQMSEALWRIVNRCWADDPRQRLTASELQKELCATGIVPNTT